MEGHIKDRFIAFLKYLKIGQTKFEENCGINRGTINNIKDGVSSPNLSKIINAYPELNLDWLITGNGEMIKKITVDVNNENSPNSMIMSGVVGDGQRQTKGVSDETVRDLANGYQNVIRTYQEQTDRLVSVIDKLVEKYGK